MLRKPNHKHAPRIAGAALVLVSTVGLARQHIARAEPLLTPAAQRPSTLVTTQGFAETSRLRFEPNIGQFDERVRYLARGKGYGLYLTSEGPTLSLRPRDPATPRAVVSMRVVGGKHVEPVALEPARGAHNYFNGNDARGWRTGVQSYGIARYEDVRPGVNVVFYGRRDRELEYDLELAAGVDPKTIELAFEGVESIELAPDGSAVLHLPQGGALRKLPPLAYQTDDSGARRTLTSHYVVREDHLAFDVANYDAKRPLVIDPVLTYSTYLGGGSTDEAFATATDPAGNTYVVGYTTSTLFPTVSPEQPRHGGGTDDAFVAKLDPNGNFIYSTFLGGSGADVAYAVAADSAGNAYVTGVTFSTNFPTVSPVQASAGGMQDTFVAKLDPQGASLLYSTYLGGSQDDYPGGIALALGKAIVVGTTSSTNFPLAAPLQSSLNGVADAFVTALSPSGSALVYSTYLGGSGFEFGHAIATDSVGNAFVAGSTASTNFPLVSPLQSAFAGGSYDGFVSKLNATGSSLTYSTYLGGVFTDEALSIACSGTGIATVGGYTSSTNFPVWSAAQTSLGSAGFTDGFVSRLSIPGNTLQFSTYLGGSDDDRVASVAVDSLGSTYAVGSTLSTNFPVLKALSGQSSYHGASDGFVTAIDPSGSFFNYSSYLGGAAEDHATGVAVQANGTTHIVGSTFSTDFPTASAAINHLVGAEDAFISELPGVALAVPAGRWWTSTCLFGLLLGAGLLLIALRKRSATPAQSA